MPQPGSEGLTRQKHPRAAVKLKARLSTIDAEREPRDGSAYYRICDDTCVNLSLQGAQVSSEEPMLVGQRLLVEIELPDAKVFEARARVAWSIVRSVEPGRPVESGTGLEFTRVSRANARILDGFLTTALRRSRTRRAPQTKPSNALRT